MERELETQDRIASLDWTAASLQHEIRSLKSAAGWYSNGQTALGLKRRVRCPLASLAFRIFTMTIPSYPIPRGKFQASPGFLTTVSFALWDFSMDLNG